MANPLPPLVVGSPTGDNVTIIVDRQERPGSTDPHDRAWLRCAVGITAGAFTARYTAALRADDFISFDQAVSKLYESLGGEARFCTMERWIEFILRGDGKGHVEVQGVASDDPAAGNSLAFKFTIDQTYLVPVLATLQVLSAFCREAAGA